MIISQNSDRKKERVKTIVSALIRPLDFQIMVEHCKYRGYNGTKALNIEQCDVVIRMYHSLENFR